MVWIHLVTDITNLGYYSKLCSWYDLWKIVPSSSRIAGTDDEAFGGGTSVVFRLNQRRVVCSSVTLRRARAARIGSHASDQSFVVDLVRASGQLLLPLESWVRGAQAHGMIARSGESNRWVLIWCGLRSVGLASRVTHQLIGTTACLRRGLAVLFLHCPGSRPDGAPEKEIRFHGWMDAPACDRPSTPFFSFFF